MQRSMHFGKTMLLAGLLGLAEPMGKGRSYADGNREALHRQRRRRGNHAFFRSVQGGTKSTREVKSRPCLHCGKSTNHINPFCSKEHKLAWEKLNPGNGRYLRLEWHEAQWGSFATLHNYTVLSKKGAQRREELTGVRTKPYTIDTIDSHGNLVVLDAEFDCMIDAQRHVERLIDLHGART